VTRGHHLDDEEVLRALRQCNDSQRDTGGGWHPQVVAAALHVSPSAVRNRCQDLADEGRVVAVDGLGPTGPRVSYLPAGHDAVGSDDG